MMVRKILLIAVGFAAALVLAGYGYGLFAHDASPFKRITGVEIQQALAAESAPKSENTGILPDRVLGSAKAPVTIVEYASFTCPHCAHFQKDIFPKIKSDFIDKGLVRWIMRPFPFDGVALNAAVMAYCLPKEQYYPFVDAVFASQEEWAQSQDPNGALRKIARLAGLNDDKLKQCNDGKSGLSEGLLRGRVNAEKELGVKSTPTFLVNGEKLEGSRDFEVYKNAIENALKSAAKPQ